MKSNYYWSRATKSISKGKVVTWPVYFTWKLPIKDRLPNKIYIDGRLGSMGTVWQQNAKIKILGDNIIKISVAIQNLEVALDYGDWMYYYEIVNKVVYKKNNVEITEMCPKLISQIKQYGETNDI